VGAVLAVSLQREVNASRHLKRQAMTKLVVDEPLRSKLHDLRDHAELCDASGQTLGHFLPSDVYQSLLYAALEDPGLTPEEIRRRLQQPGGRSLSEIWKQLGRT
jgi:hypothetical protein